MRQIAGSVFQRGSPLPRYLRAMGYGSERAALGRRSRRCQRVQADVTGVVERVHARARARHAGELPRHKPDLFLDDGFDLVVSANILSQLPVIPNGYAAPGRFDAR